MEPGARFESIQIPLEEPLRDAETLSGVLGIPEWWPTGSRIGVVLAHAAGRDLNDPFVSELHRQLTERKYLSLRFNFPFAEVSRKRPDPETILVRAFRAAIALMGRDPTSAPAHLFIGGIGLGAQAAALVSTQRLRVEGVIFMGYPLHGRDDPSKQPNADPLFRVVNPMLFVQGTRDRYCDIPSLRETLKRVGAPKALQVVQDVDHHFQATKKVARETESIAAEVVEGIDRWCTKVLGL